MGKGESKMAVIPMQETTVYGMFAAAIIGWFAFFGLMVFIKSKIPETVVYMKSSMLKRPIVNMHTSLKLLLKFAPKREGGDGNMYETPKEFGVKLIPSHEKVEHTMYGRREINFYSKAGTALTAKEVKACEDVYDTLKEFGIEPTESIVDALFIASDEELKKMYEDDEVMLRTVVQIKERLKNQFIKDGQFVWQTAENFIFAAASETARGMDEYKSIAEERADERVKPGMSKDSRMMIFYMAFFLMLIAIVYKIAFA